jgi:spore maturation protein CgeB
VFGECFANARAALNGKAISSRHFEPIGTRTCQLLVEGSYNGILEGDRHYISVKRDLSNVEDAIRRFKDAEYRAAITAAAHDHVMSHHTYSHRVAELVGTVFGRIAPAAVHA